MPCLVIHDAPDKNQKPILTLIPVMGLHWYGGFKDLHCLYHCKKINSFSIHICPVSVIQAGWFLRYKTYPDWIMAKKQWIDLYKLSHQNTELLLSKKMTTRIHKFQASTYVRRSVMHGIQHQTLSFQTMQKHQVLQIWITANSY